jgi:hypothetical protein
MSATPWQAVLLIGGRSYESPLAGTASTWRSRNRTTAFDVLVLNIMQGSAVFLTHLALFQHLYHPPRPSCDGCPLSGIAGAAGVNHSRIPMDQRGDAVMAGLYGGIQPAGSCPVHGSTTPVVWLSCGCRPHTIASHQGHLCDDEAASVVVVFQPLYPYSRPP